MKKKFLVVLVPHFAPDTAPTGEVISTLVEEFVAMGQRVHVVTALPWYRNHCVEPGWTGRLVRRETTSWGSIIRVHPFAGKDKKKRLDKLKCLMLARLFKLVRNICVNLDNLP